MSELYDPKDVERYISARQQMTEYGQKLQSEPILHEWITKRSAQLSKEELMAYGKEFDHGVRSTLTLDTGYNEWKKLLPKHCGSMDHSVRIDLHRICSAFLYQVRLRKTDDDLAAFVEMMAWGISCGLIRYSVSQAGTQYEYIMNRHMFWN